MLHTLLNLNWLAVAGTAVIGFLVGWLWYSPVLFAKPWMAEMKYTEQTMKEATQKGMARFLVPGFIYTFFSTLGMALLVSIFDHLTLLQGAKLGCYVGLLLVGTRILNKGVWEQRTLKLNSIVVGHEVVLFTLQGAILAVWN